MPYRKKESGEAHADSVVCTNIETQTKGLALQNFPELRVSQFRAWGNVVYEGMQSHHCTCNSIGDIHVAPIKNALQVEE